jgi:chromosome segregation ATPase
VKVSTDMEYRDLRSSLQNLSDQSLETSRRIDDTYYSLLERVSGLHRTLGNLQSLAGLTKELQDNFDSDTNEIIEDIEGQYEGFGKFEKQQEHIVRLETRIKAGREKADGLHARLMEAKRRVEARAKSEEDLETRNTRMYSCLHERELLLIAHRTSTHSLGHYWRSSPVYTHGDSVPAVQADPYRRHTSDVGFCVKRKNT